jgi:hypothetical protein
MAVFTAAFSAGADDGQVVVRRGGKFQYRVHKAPRFTSRLGPVALAGLDAVGGSKGDVPSALGAGPPELGKFPAGELGGAASGRAPFGVRGQKPCRDCKTTIADGRRERAAALWLTRDFELDGTEELSSLELRVRYQDGLVIHLNGHEVARRNLPADSGTVAIAGRKRGPEWESIWLAVVPGLVRKGSNRLAVEVRPSGYRDGPSFDFELVAWARSKLTRGPIVQRRTGNEAIIRFSTDAPVKAEIEWGPSSKLGKRVTTAGGGLAINHRAVLRGLPAKAPFFYRVKAGATVSPTYKVGAWPSGGTIRFAVYGDMRGGHRVHERISEAIGKEAADFVVVTGDLVLRGSDGGDWQRFFQVAADLLARTPYYPVAGNHDLGRSGHERRLMNELFELPEPPAKRPAWGNWYSFDVADLHFVMLDSNAYKHSEQQAWLIDDLAAARARGVRAIFAAVHDGPYSRGLHRGNRYAQATYVPVLHKYGVDMLFSGHDHLYQRGEVDGLRYAVSGGGGAPLYSVRCGNKGQRKCRVADGMKHIDSTYHYLLVTVRNRTLEMCPKRPDGTAVEACVSYRLRRRK